MLEIHRPLALTIADMDEWKNYAYVVFFLLAGLTSLLGKLKRPGRDKKTPETAVQEPLVEAEILPEPDESPMLVAPTIPTQAVSATVIPLVPRSFEERPSIIGAPPIPVPSRRLAPMARPQPVRRETPTPAPLLSAQAAYAKDAERPKMVIAKPVVPPDSARRISSASTMATVRRLISKRSGQRAAFVLHELFAPPIALRDAHLDR
jgi:hypothetical protein